MLTTRTDMRVDLGHGVVLYLRPIGRDIPATLWGALSLRVAQKAKSEEEPVDPRARAMEAQIERTLNGGDVVAALKALSPLMELARKHQGEIEPLIAETLCSHVVGQEDDDGQRVPLRLVLRREEEEPPGVIWVDTLAALVPLARVWERVQEVYLAPVATFPARSAPVGG